MSVRATYRVQLHKGFIFADAEAIVPYLARLGISHLYASPITTAQPGSMHGYDVIDPTGVNPELGGEDGLRRLVAALKRHGLGLIIDIVPNHMGIAGGRNAWWQDVLRRGQASAHAAFFDIDWSEKILLPFLGEPLAKALENGVLQLKAGNGGIDIVAYDAMPFPVRPEDEEEVRARGFEAYDADAMVDLLSRQHYSLAWWRTGNDALNWRRFFTITELAGLRVEDEAVFEATHALYLRLYEEGLIDGVRVDHVDGLTDPAGYCRKLRARLDAIRPGAYFVVEKILAAHEPLARDWGVDGTTGYDFMEQASALLHAPWGADPLSDHWAALSGRSAEFAPEELRARQDMLAWEFEGQLDACVRAFCLLAQSSPDTAHLTSGMLRRAIERLLWVFPVYRTYGTGTSAPATDAKIRRQARERALPLSAPGEEPVIETVLDWLAGEGPGDHGLAAAAVRRFQQLSAPIAAKAVEDTAFYRYGRLLSRNDVGFEAARMALPIEDFHSIMAARAAHWPRAMLATATHDHKRGEDVRARLAVLSAIPGEWIGVSRNWLAMAGTGDIAAGDAYQLHQMLVGAWPTALAADDAKGLATFRDRITAWQEKALREAKLRSSWAAPNEAYESKARRYLERLLDPGRSGDFLRELTQFVARIRPAAEANSLVQTVLRCTAPGMPDLYQGCEFEDLSLVDPDNRRPVDYAARARMPGSPNASFDARKQGLIAALLRLRAEHAALFLEGAYEPVRVGGARAAHVVAFLRRGGGGVLLVAVAIRCAAAFEGRSAPPSAWWEDTRLTLPRGLPATAIDPLTGASGTVSGEAPSLFAEAQVALRLFTRPAS